MKKNLLVIGIALLCSKLTAQNLLTNPDAESLPRGMGWTVVSEGALTCTSSPTTNYLNWTMKPDGTANYPFDHTTGTSGGTVFYSGCDNFFTGPFELQQTVDVSADAAFIDLGNQLYAFSGFMQTPVSPQTDQGRFIVDYLNASNAILGTSYTTNWQSNFGGSGAGWINYSNTRIAPIGTRKIKVRMQTQLLFNRPAINVYFDDISLTKSSIVPVTLLSFSGRKVNGNNQLNWQLANTIDAEKIELERSSNAIHFNNIATIISNNNSNNFIDANNNNEVDQYYRLKIISRDGSIFYSNVIVIKTNNLPSIILSPNPASSTLTVSGLSQAGMLSIFDCSGSNLFSTTLQNTSIRLSVSQFPEGVYIIRFSNSKNTVCKKLLVRH